MKTSIVLLMISLLFCSFLIAEEGNDIVNEITNYNISGEQFLARAQHLVIDYFEDENFAKIDSILNVVQKYYTDQQFLGSELNIILMNMWLGNYNNLFKINPNNVRHYCHRRYVSNHFEQTKIGILLIEKTKSKYDALIDKINKTELTEDRKEYIELLLEYTLYGSDDFFNEKATNFLLKYPSSDIAHKVSQMRHIYEVTNNGLLVNMNLNYGLISGNLKETFENHYGINSYIDVIFESISIHLNLDYDICKLKKDIDTSNTWTKGKKTSLMKYGMAFGYPISVSKRIRMSPNVGIAGMQFTSAKNDKDAKTISLYPAFTTSLIFDFLFKRNEEEFVAFDHCIRFRVHYQNPAWQNRGELFSGSSLVFSVGYALFINDKIRKY